MSSPGFHCQYQLMKSLKPALCWAPAGSSGTSSSRWTQLTEPVDQEAPKLHPADLGSSRVTGISPNPLGLATPVLKPPPICISWAPTLQLGLLDQSRGFWARRKATNTPCICPLLLLLLLVSAGKTWVGFGPLKRNSFCLNFAQGCSFSCAA